MTVVQASNERPPEKFGTSLQSRLLITFLIGVLSSIIAGIGLYGWTKSDYMDDIYRTKRPWYGWDLRSVAALFVFNTLAPVAFCVMFTIFQFLVRFYSTSKATASSYKLSIFVSCLFFFAIAAFGVYWSTTYLKCGFFLCIDTPFWTMKSTNGTRRESGVGWMVSVGIPFIFVGVGCIGVMIAAYLENKRMHASTTRDTGVKHAKHDSSVTLLSSQDAQLSDEEISTIVRVQDEKYKIKRYTPYNIHILALSDEHGSSQHTPSKVTMSSSKDGKKMNILTLRKWSIFLMMFLFIASCFLLSTYIPNEYRKWYPTSMTNQARVRISYDEYECRHQGLMRVTCPEVPYALLKSFSITVNEYFSFKFFASNVIFFSFLIIAPLCALLFRQSKAIDELLSQKIRVPKPVCRRDDKRSYAERSAFFTGYEMLMMFFTMLMGYLFFHYWFFDHNYSYYWPTRRPYVEISEIWCRAIGQVAVFFFALLLFPAARSSPILSFFGVSWEAAIQYHRWLGVLFLLMCVGHGLTAYWWYYVAGMFPDAIWKIPHPNPKTRDNFTLPGIQILTWLSLVTIGLFVVYEPLRRKRYNLFLFAHHFTYMALIPLTIWHAAASWEYMLPGLAIWFSDRLIRAYRSLRAVYLVSAGDINLQQKLAPQQGHHESNMYSKESIDHTFITPSPIVSIHHHTSNQVDSIKRTTDDLRVNGDDYGVNSHHASQHQHPQQPMTIVPHDISKHRNARHIANSGYGVRLLDRRGAGQYIELRIVNNHMVYFPGHYAFLNIAELSLFEWHPFTMASPVHYCGRSEIVFLIKTMGPNTWTQALYNYIETEQQYLLPHERLNGKWADEGYVNVPLTLSIDGPYGTPVDFTTYDVVLLVGGGIGITPCKSVYESMLLSYLHDYKARQTTSVESIRKIANDDLKKSIHLVFMARDLTLFDVMEESLLPICHEHEISPFTASLHCTKGDEDPEHKLSSLIHYHRPNLAEDLLAVVQRHCDAQRPKTFHDPLPDDPESINQQQYPTTPQKKTSYANQEVYTPRVLVFTCGPETMVKEAELVAYKYGWDYHCETFEL